MSPDPEKIKTITNWPEPENKEAVKSFLQTIQFVSAYMRGYAGETLADITKPLRELTAIKAKFIHLLHCMQPFMVYYMLIVKLTKYMTKYMTIYTDTGQAIPSSFYVVNSTNSLIE